MRTCRYSQACMLLQSDATFVALAICQKRCTDVHSFSKGQKLLYCWFKAVPQTVPWLHRLGYWKGCCIWSCFWDQHELKKSSVQVKYSHHYATIAYYSQANRYTCSTAQHKYLDHQSQAVTLPVYLGMPTWLRQSADVQTNYQKKSD